MDNTISGDIYIGGGETQAIKLIANIMKELSNEYPGIRYHLYSGNAPDVTDRLDKGLLDFGLLIQPADLTKYDYLNLPEKDSWGVIMRQDSPLAEKEYIEKEDLLKLPLICSRQVVQLKGYGNQFAEWFGEDYKKLNIVTTFNLIYNATIMVETGMGYAITIDKLINTKDSSLCFRPLKPKLESRLNIIWKNIRSFLRQRNCFAKAERGIRRISMFK